jgi:hypothetical protein
MADTPSALPVDRKLHSVHRAIVYVLISIASVLMLLWLVDTISAVDLADVDGTWLASAGIRLATFLAMTILAFLASYRSQPGRIDSGERARPTPANLRLRVIAAVAAALFFGDQTASSFAAHAPGDSWVAIVGTALLALLTLAAVISVATGRAALRLWRDAGQGVELPLWREPTEAEIHRSVPSVGAQTVWLLVFLAAWLLANDLPPIVPLASGDASVTMTLLLEGANIATIAIAHYYKREIALCDLPYASRSRALDIVMAILGTGMSAEVGIRAVLVFGELPALGFWLAAAVCILGLAAGTLRFLRSVQAPGPSAD